MIALDYRDRRPLYEQIIERFQDLMYQEVLKENEKLPSVRSLAMELSINPNTIQRAYTELERQGFIYSVKGKGSFVADSGRLRRERLREWEREFDRLAEEGFQIGLSAEDLTGRIRSLEEKREEGGMNHD
ncbi:MAG TPA: GntR family transcriptional regulator [Candidatus Enterocloster excrementigallinarum]|uniref:GntR family transcriptional regulator n=1 Tax=Candidatus Enterocloster excrementigallinarum TaxID=2838558 RepID=A0A9D2TEY3_9FIRM|nr:GntR family transcriptional regulator [Candidatus Enterocloster excrementigallinarum]